MSSNPLYEGLDQPSFQLGIIDCFCEMVHMGVKTIALSSPLDPDFYEQIRERAERIAQSFDVKWYLEKDFLVTDLFSSGITEEKWVIMFYRDDETIETYKALKDRQKELVAKDAYDPRAREAVSWAFARLLSYPDWKIEEMLARKFE